MNLSALTELSLPNVASVPVDITGGWSGPTTWEWIGVARAPEDIVAIAMLSDRTGVNWAKSSWKANQQMPIRLLLLPYDPDSADVQVNLSVADANRRWRATMPSPTYRPVI